MFACFRCAADKYTVHSPEPPHVSLGTPCEGFANVLDAGVYSYDPNLPEAEGGFEGGGGSSGGGGSTGGW